MSQQQYETHKSLEMTFAAVIQKAAAILDPDEVKLLCYGCGVQIQPSKPDMDDLFDGNTF